MSGRLARVSAALGVALCVMASSPSEAQSYATRLVRVDEGVVFPFYGRGTANAAVLVPAFQVEATPVTNAQFLAFVRSTPRWQRGRVARLFADERYLAHWAGPETLGAAARPNQPVTHVSWFAARAYCSSLGRRLPSEHEWELVAQADATRRDASRDPAFVAQILEWYSQPRGVLADVGQRPANRYGAHDMHGLVWEWVLDFNAVMVDADNRQGGDAASSQFCGGGSVAARDSADYAAFMRYAFRSSLQAAYTVPNLGFRCAQ